MRLSLIGALTSKPYAFRARPWELRNFDSIDIFDSYASNIKLSLRGSEPLRVLPSVFNGEEWITDKIRFFYDSLLNQRLLNPYLFSRRKNWFSVFSFLKIFPKYKNRLYSNENIIFNIQNFNNFDFFNHLKYLKNNIKNSSSFFGNLAATRPKDLRNSIYITNNNQYKNIILVGLNLRVEVPVLNIQLKKNVFLGKIKIYNLGSKLNSIFPYIHVGNNLHSLIKLLEGKHIISSILRDKNYIFLIGQSLLSVYFNFCEIVLKNKNYNCIYNSLSFINYLEINNMNNQKKKSSSNYINWYIDNDSTALNKNLNKFSIYQGHHGDINVKNSELLLPTTFFQENIISVFNIFGKHKYYNFISLSNPNYVNLRSNNDILNSFNSFLTRKELKEFNNNTKLLMNHNINLLNNNLVLYQKIHNFPIFSIVKDSFRTESASKNSKNLMLLSNRLNNKKSIFGNEFYDL